MVAKYDTHFEEKKEKLKTYQKEYRKEYKTKKKRCNLTLTNQEYERMKKLAKRNNLTLPNQVKKLAMATLEEQQDVPAHIQKKLDDIQYELSMMGNNINQLAKHWNTQSLIKQGQIDQDFKPIMKGVFEGLNHMKEKVHQMAKESEKR